MYRIGMAHNLKAVTNANQLSQLHGRSNDSFLNEALKYVGTPTPDKDQPKKLAPIAPNTLEVDCNRFNKTRAIAVKKREKR